MCTSRGRVLQVQSNERVAHFWFEVTSGFNCDQEDGDGLVRSNNHGFDFQPAAEGTFDSTVALHPSVACATCICARKNFLLHPTTKTKVCGTRTMTLC